MATSSYSNLFGTTGAGQTGSKAGISTMFGQQAAPESEEERQRKQQQQQMRQQAQPAQTFAQLQKQGMARPAPSAPQGQPFQQFGGSQQAQQARTGMLGALQQQLAQPTRFDTEAFQKIRQAQSAQLGAEYQGQQAQLNEELARRGLSASSIGGGRMGDLAGQQARALAGLDAQLLQQAAQTQAQDRLAALQAAQGFAELAGSQDLAQFEANRVAQAAEFQQGLQGAQFQQGQTEFERGQALAAAQAQQAGGFQEMELGLRQALGLGELGLSERRQTAQEAQFGQTLAEQVAGRLQQAGLSGRELDLRATQIQQEAATQGRQLTIEEARLAAQQQQFAATQAQQAAQFGVTTELERERLAAQQEQFGEQLGFNREELALRGELGRGEQTIAEDRLAQEGRLEEARQGIQLKELAQREAQVRAELTGQVDVPVLDKNGKPTDAVQRINTIARDRLGQEKTQLAMQRAQQLTQATGIVHDLDDNGNVMQKVVGGEPVKSESVLARLSQQEIQRAEIAGYAYIQDPSDPKKTMRVASVAAQQLTQQALRDAATQAEALSQQTGIAYEVGPDGKLRQMTQVVNGQTVPVTTVQARQLEAQERQANLDRELRETLGLGELTGQVGDQQTLAARQQQFAQGQAQQQLLIQLASALAQSTNIKEADLTKMMKELYAKLGTGGNPLDNLGDTSNDAELERIRGRQAVPQGTPQTPPRGRTTTTTQTQQTSTGRSGRRGG